VRVPVKLNRAFWPRALARVLPSAADPRVLLKDRLTPAEFTDAVSTFKFATTCKTTQKARFPRTLEHLARLEFTRLPTILDVGASDGSTSLDVMDAVPFNRYFVTDKHLEVTMCTRGGTTYFHAPDGTCVLISTPAWVVYDDTAGAWPPLGAIARRAFATAGVPPAGAEVVSLVNPAVKSRPQGDVRVEQYDIFEPWRREKADLIVAANILNRVYFTEENLARAIRNLLEALCEDGRLAVIQNSGGEKATVFRLSNGRIAPEHSINGGTDIDALVLASAATRGAQPQRAAST
jgi:hypothetical protein